MDLGQRLLDAEPVERLPARHHVDAAVRQRDRLGRAVEGLHVGQRREQVLAHLVDRLDGDHAGAERDERARQLAGAGGEIEDIAAGSDLEALGEPCHRRLGIAGPAALVCVRGRREPTRRCRVDFVHDGVTR